MRKALLLPAVFAALLGLAACDEEPNDAAAPAAEPAAPAPATPPPAN